MNDLEILDRALEILDESANINNKVYRELVISLGHIIKWVYQPERRGSSWSKSIFGHAAEAHNLCYDKKRKQYNSNIINFCNINM